MSDKLLAQLKEQGFETVDAAIEHLKGLQTAQEAAADQDREKFEKVIADVVERQFAALVNKGETARKATISEVTGQADDAQVAELQNDMWLLGMMLQRSPKTFDPERVRKGYALHTGKEFSTASLMKAMDTTEQSAWVPTGLGNVLLADVEAQSPLFDNVTVLPMPTNPWEPPYQSSQMSVYGVDESTEDSASAVGATNFGANKVTLTAKKIGARALWSRELDEDSAIAILPQVQADFVRAIRNGWERNFMMGDERATTSNINCYGANPTTTAGAKDPWLQTDGLVKWALVTNSGQSASAGGAIDKAKYLAVRLKMGKYGDNPANILTFVNRDLLYDMLQLEYVLTLEKYGAKATILTGELGSFFGSPIMVSDGLPKTCASGYIDGSTPANNSKKSFVLLNKAVGIVVGRKGDLRVAVEAINRTDQYEGVIFSRYDLGFPFVQGVAYGYNVT